jgi:phage protein D
VELVDLSSSYGEFYAPAFAIRIGRDDLMRDLVVGVSQLEVELPLSGCARFNITIVDAYDFKSHSFQTGLGQDLLELLDFGTEVDFFMGYGDVKSLKPMMSGVVTELTTSFPETGSPELSVAGYDRAFPMTLGKNARTWAKARDSDAVQDITGFNNLAAVIDDTEERHAQIEQNQESDFAFMQKLAKRNHFEIFVDENRVLHFTHPHDKAGAIVRLAWGEGLLSFKPMANLAGQVSRVEVYGWDRNQKKAITGVAEAGEESGLTGRSAGQILNAFVRDPGKKPTLRIRQPVFTQSEAEERAKAALNDCAKRFLTGEAEAIGLPELRPDRNVLLDKLGKAFSKVYYIEHATHKIDSNGYRTRFSVKETGYGTDGTSAA